MRVKKSYATLEVQIKIQINTKTMQQDRDILADLDIMESQNLCDDNIETQAIKEMQAESHSVEIEDIKIQRNQEIEDIKLEIQGNVKTSSELDVEDIIQDDTIPKVMSEKTPARKIFGTIKFLMQYSFTSIIIFAVLMIWVNHQAYFTLLNAYINAEQMEQNRQSMIESVSAAASVVRSERGEENIDLSFITRQTEARELSLEDRHSPSRLLAKASREDINLDISITPYEDRVVIPKIGKNIPLVEVSNRHAESVSDLHNIFMEELEQWVVRYPWTALPGEKWNSFIFWHSSNFPWLPWDYNEVFALLGRLEVGDEIIVYHNQRKFVYIVREKTVVRPWNTSVLRNHNEDEKLITLMTCWPIGTTTDRLLVIWELQEIK